MRTIILSKKETPDSVEILIPPSKSHTMRAILLAVFSNSNSEIHNYLDANDTRDLIIALKKMGVDVEVCKSKIIVKGIGRDFSLLRSAEINAGNSGQILRFLSAFLSLSSNGHTITGDSSVCNNRPVKDLISAFHKMGATVKYLKKQDHPPFFIKGPLKPAVVNTEGEDSQPVSALLMASVFLEGTTIIHVNNPGEKPWVELTLNWLRNLGAHIKVNNYHTYTINGPISYDGFFYSVPGDFSSAAFPAIASIITKKSTILSNLDMTDVQGDKKLFEELIRLGANIEIDKKNKKVFIHTSELLSGGSIDVNDFIDAVPILAVLGCFTKTKLELVNCAIAKKKESNRLEAISEELEKMGAKIKYFDDKLVIWPSDLYGAELNSRKDHRIAMALSVAALSTNKGKTIIEDVDCVNKSYPNFFDNIIKFGANIEWVTT
ncbi:MAG: 3-phosphoshikimate 1-carboxyvinyltransferase [Chlamydiota bacterium]|jgi:3-phosphoshikimate 1-carboxyvinyltransferase